MDGNPRTRALLYKSDHTTLVSKPRFQSPDLQACSCPYLRMRGHTAVSDVCVGSHGVHTSQLARPSSAHGDSEHSDLCYGGKGRNVYFHTFVQGLRADATPEAGELADRQTHRVPRHAALAARHESPAAAGAWPAFPFCRPANSDITSLKCALVDFLVLAKRNVFPYICTSIYIFEIHLGIAFSCPWQFSNWISLPVDVTQ